MVSIELPNQAEGTYPTTQLVYFYMSNNFDSI